MNNTDNAGTFVQNVLNNGKHAFFERGMVRLLLSTGRADGVRVNHVVGTLSHGADIPGRSLGKISIQQQHTLVDVPEKLVGQVLGKGPNYRIGNKSVTVQRA